MAKKKKIDVSGGDSDLGVNPFASLNSLGLPEQEKKKVQVDQSSGKAKTKKKMRVEIRREKGGRGGKVVTTLTGLHTLDPRSRDELLKKLKNICASGGAYKENIIEIQGDHRERLLEFFKAQNYSPVLAGG